MAGGWGRERGEMGARVLTETEAVLDTLNVKDLSLADAPLHYLGPDSD